MKALDLYLVLVVLFFIIAVFNKEKFKKFLKKGQFQDWFYIFIALIIFIIISVFYTFSFIFAFLGLGLFLLIDSAFGNNDPKPVYEEFPVYIEPMEVKTSCNTNKDGCKISDNYYCDICEGGIHNRHW